MHLCVNNNSQEDIEKKKEILAMRETSTTTMTELAVKYLFPGQEVTNNFRSKLQEYIKKQYEDFSCVTLYIANNPELTQSFRKFMENFPDLDCGNRQVIIYQNGSMSYRDNYHHDRRIPILEVSF